MKRQSWRLMLGLVISLLLISVASAKERGDFQDAEGHWYVNMWHYLCSSGERYFDFYATATQLAEDSVQVPLGFTCATVKINGRRSYYPVTSTFALSIEKTATFSIPIVQYGNLLGYAAPKGTPTGQFPYSGCPMIIESTGHVLSSNIMRRYFLSYGSDNNSTSSLYSVEPMTGWIVGNYKLDTAFDAVCALQSR